MPRNNEDFSTGKKLDPRVFMVTCLKTLKLVWLSQLKVESTVFNMQESRAKEKLLIEKNFVSAMKDIAVNSE